MTDALRNLLISAAVIILFLWLIAFFTFSSRLSDAVDRLERAEQKMDSTFQTLVAARTTIDTVHKSLMKFGTYVRDIQGRVEILDLNERMSKAKFRTDKADIVNRLSALYKEIETTGRELPEIPVKTSEKEEGSRR